MLVTGTHARALAPGLYTIFQDRFTEVPGKADLIFNTEKGDGRKILDAAQVTGFGYPEKVGETELYPMMESTMGPGKPIEAVKWGMGYEISDELRIFDRYGIVGQLPQKMADSMQYFRDLLAADVLVRGNTNVRVGPYGQPLFSNAQVIARTGATQSNLLAPAALSAATLQAGLTVYRQRKNSEGRTTNVRPKFLVVGTKNEWIGRLLLSNEKVLGSNNNDANLLRQEGLELIVWDKLDLLAPDAWFLLPDKGAHRLIKFEPVPMDTKFWDDHARDVTVQRTRMFLTYDFWSDANVVANFGV